MCSQRKNLLLIMPFFMGYHNMLNTVLQLKYNVTLVNSELYDQDVLKTYYNCHTIRWGFRKCFPFIKKKEQENATKAFVDDFLMHIQKQKDYYQVVLCVNGAYISSKVYETIKRNNPKARYIYYAWDDLKNLFKTFHIKFFDEKYSYNINDCKRKRFSYLPMFVAEDEVEGHAVKDEYDISYIASAHSDRIDIANKLYEKYGEKYRLFIYLYSPQKTNEKFCHSSALSYEEYMNIMRKSKVILDVPHISQTGPTTRLFDALLTKTKVITTNSYIKDYPVYSSNISIVDRRKLILDDEFIKRPYIETDYHPLTVSKWLKRIGV